MTMNKTIKFLGAAMFCAAVAFGSVSCGENKSKKDLTSQADSTACTAPQGAIVYFNLDVILEKYDMANELSSVVQTKAQNIEAEVQRRGKKIEKAEKDFNEKLEKGLMTRSVAEAEAQKIQKQAAEWQKYAGEKQQEIQEELMVMNNQIADAIKTYIQKYNEEKKFAMILTCQAGQPVLVADPSLDITNEVLAGLNAEYVKTKNSKKND
jgi:outer membrane protein